MKLFTKFHQNRLQIILFCFVAALLYTVSASLYFSSYNEARTIVRNIKNNLLILTDITDESVEPKNKKNLFFVDTFRMQPKYEQQKALNIGKRQSCAIESAALFNPHLTIYVGYVTHEQTPKLRLTSELSALIQYPNIKFVSIDHDSFPTGSPLDNFFMNNSEILTSPFVVAHVSDAYRLLLLWKYGGIYYDTDVISLNSAKNAPNNFACDDGEGYIVANGIIGLDTTKGREFAEKFIKFMTSNYKANEWGTNGPIVLTKVMNEVCKTKSMADMIKMESCDGFHVLPQKTCYPIPWPKYNAIFNETFTNELLTLISKESVTFHLWNNLSKGNKIDVEKDSFFNRIAKEKCPKVFEAMKHDSKVVI